MKLKKKETELRSLVDPMPTDKKRGVISELRKGSPIQPRARLARVIPSCVAER
jgi:hypothetical protein